MAVLVDKNTRVVVQGITGSQGSLHARACKEYGTQVVAGVTPGKGGQDFEGIPIFNLVREAVDKEGADVSLIFVPPPFAADAIMEAADAGIGLIICITEGVPVLDMVKAVRYVKRVVPGSLDQIAQESSHQVLPKSVSCQVIFICQAKSVWCPDPAP